ncbi:HdeD family acid-resistance protein [Leptospira stimsonii]|uniref:HdeD family acid-resistance protein n=1 Tax=Leptospira stimsonii TaxID=2202203 RepID=A0A4R9L0F7_9LEPT|nr:DUF308 domain-containing protein [Leptospira stimsonii]RHX86681.1 hypothetical protein DLM78_12935 [Leptospira stimsonii]TGK13331.1 hypothetical protein EHO98_18530 [Leptospira stimsonii]TGM09109.1 hypothetical protein EHQ90_21270 [Leptospira stimsonii]
MSIFKDTKHWWLHILVGLIWIATGAFTVFFPRQSYLGLALLFSVILAVTGVAQIVFAFYNRKSPGILGWNLVLGIVDLVVGTILVLHPEITVVTLPFIFGFLLIFRASSLISFSMEIRVYKSYPWGWTLALGIATLLFAIGILFFPVIGIFTILIWTGTGFLISGIGNVYLGWKEWEEERRNKES